MLKFKTFIIFVILIAIWTTFFAAIKFYLWGINGNTLNIDLQKIAGYLSFGSIFAFLIGGAFASVFLKKYYLFIISILSLLFVSVGYFIGFNNSFSFALIVILLGFLYGLWSVIKKVIIAIEIKKTGMRETFVNAVVGITFTLFIIIGSIIGSLLFEKLGQNGYLVIMGLLIFASIASFNLDYDKISFSSLIQNGWGNYFFERKQSLKQALKAYIPDLKYIFKNYSLIIIASSFLWTISTITSQASVEFSIKTFNIEASTATFILFYAAIGAIIGNILSIKMNSKRWAFFFIGNILFSIIIILFPFLAINFKIMIICTVILGIFFGICSNLVDSFLFKKIGDEDKKEYGASTIGVVFSIILFFMMFLSSKILSLAGYTTLMIFLGINSIIIGGFLYFKQKKLGN